MKFSKAIKKIVALGTSATMLVGATMAAADLANYPAPFIKDGKFSGILVVGDKAAAEDVIGVSDIAMSLQYAATKKVTTTTTATTTVEGDAFKIAKSGDNLNFYQQLSDIQSSATSSDLNALADGTVTNAHGTYTYNQYIDMPTNANVTYVIDSDQSYDPATYLKFASGSTVYLYKLSFPAAIKSDIDTNDDYDDLDNKKLTILGKEYTIINTDNSTGMIKMMGGAVEDTMEEGQTKTYTINGIDYEVTVNAITDTAPIRAKFTINGEVTEALEVTDTYKLKDGTEIGIKEILPNEAGDITADIVSFYLGAQSVEFKDSNFASGGHDGTITVGGSDLDNTFCKISGTYSSATASISSIEVNYTADDDYYIPVGGKLSDVISDPDDLFLNNIDYEFAAAQFGTTEEIKISPAATDKYKVKMPTKTGGEVNIDAFYSNSSGGIELGRASDRQIVTTSGAAIGEKDMFITSSGKYSHLVEVTSLSSASATDPSVKFTDKGASESQDISVANASTGTVYFDGYAVSFVPNYNAQTIAITTFGSDAGCFTQGACLYAPSEARVDLTTTTENASGYADSWKEGKVTVTEYHKGHGDDTTATVRQINVTVYDAGSGATEKITTISPTSDDTMFSLTSWDSKDNFQTAYTLWGTYVEYDTPSGSSQNTVTITIPKEEARFDVFLTSGATTTSAVEGGTIEGVTIERIEVGATKLASEVASVTAQNAILVGGPCANAAAATAMGNPADCTAGFEPGKGLIQLFEHANGNVAMLVAGYAALDTRNACQVVANYGDYALSGTKMEVTKTTTGGLQVAEAAEVVEDTTTDDTTV